MAPKVGLQALLEASWKGFWGKLAPKKPSRAVDEGGGRDDTKQVENVRPRMVRGRRDLVPEIVILGVKTVKNRSCKGCFETHAFWIRF